MKRFLVRALILAGFVVLITVAQNIIFDRREATLRQIPKGASQSYVLGVLGSPTRKTGDIWYYKETLVGLFRYDLRTDDMLIVFEDGKLEDAWMTPD